MNVGAVREVALAPPPLLLLRCKCHEKGDSRTIAISYYWWKSDSLDSSYSFMQHDNLGHDDRRCSRKFCSICNQVIHEKGISTLAKWVLWIEDKDELSLGHTLGSTTTPMVFANFGLIVCVANSELAPRPGPQLTHANVSFWWEILSKLVCSVRDSNSHWMWRGLRSLTGHWCSDEELTHW